MRTVRTLSVAGALALLLAGCAAGSDSATRGAGPTQTPSSRDSAAVPALHATAPVTHAVARPVDRCAANRAGQLVLVDLSEQHLWLCAHARTVRDTPITSGMDNAYTHTPTGTFHVQGRNRDTTLTLNTGATYAVKYWIPFDAPLFGFHDASWQKFAFGSAKYKTDGSHGCVHVPLADMAFLYRWVHVGARVTIRS